MSDATRTSQLVTSRLILRAIVAVCALLALVSAVLFQAPGLLGRDKVLTDFDAFYIAGTMAGHGKAGQTYQAAEMMAEQQATYDTSSFMPWTYPPPYTLFMQGLARLPIGVAYLLFITMSFVFYLAVLRRIAGAFLPGVLIAIAPALILTVRTAQNGFLTGGLVGWFLWSFIRHRAVAGVPLGLMVLKPHLAFGIALLALLGRRWKAMAIAAAIVVAALLAATASFGFGIWAAFLGGVREASGFLAEGYYPLFRMTSVYAGIRAAGGPAPLALTVHAAGALAAAGLLLYAWWRGCEARFLAAIACVASLFISPYSYDYDLMIFGVALAFVLPSLIERARPLELAGMMILSWLATGYGFAMNVLGESANSGIATLKLSNDFFSISGLLLLILVTQAWMILRRPPVVARR